MLDDLRSYLDSSGIKYTIADDNLSIGAKTCHICSEVGGKIIDIKSWGLLDYCDEYDWQIFSFGGRWYYSTNKEATLTPLEYVGEAKLPLFMRSFLGVHGAMEILSGSRLYPEWVQKAKFLGLESLGICERNTLSGAVKFQLACKKAGIKPIIGMSFNVKTPTIDFVVKAFVRDEEGWANMLKISKAVSIDNVGFIPLEQLLECEQGLSVIVDPKSTDYKLFEGLGIVNWYYTLDTSEYVSSNADNDFFTNLGSFVDSHLEPIAAPDAYYLERDHAYAIEMLNAIKGKVTKKFTTKHWFMDENEYFAELEELFKGAKKAEKFFVEACQNLEKVSNGCNFTIPEMSPSARHLPEYNMTPEELEKYGTANVMLESLVAEGLHTKIPSKLHPRYLAQIKLELEVLDLGNVRHYFLILWDIIRWSREQGILVGIGRGSAAGSMVAYLMDITGLDPFDYDLIFERFLNPGRVVASLPDIDVNFSGKRRDEIKSYITEKYGADQFCDVGTYTNLKPKSLIKELGKIMEGYEHYVLNEITKYWPNGTNTMEDVFRLSAKDKRTKAFLHKHPALVNDCRLISHQPKAESIHACATIIVPNDKTIFEYIPVKWMIRDGKRVLISQWEGPELEATGFLKEDILAATNLDKYEMILNRIKADTGEEVNLVDIPLDDQVVMAYFHRGDNSDVPQFGTSGLTQFCREMKPDNIHDLIAAVALYRPGPMEQGYHKQFVKRKNGLEEVTYLPECEAITKDTYGVICYQEQVMRICQHVGGLTLAEADSIRKAMVKKDINSIGKFIDQFKTNAIEQHHIPSDEVDALWEILLSFSKYAFNKSHSAAYSIESYQGQWLKHYYPLQFWATAFSFASDDQYAGFLAEIFRSNEGLHMHPPNINISKDSVTANKETGDMYWALKGVKGVGEVAYSQIIAERDKNGVFSSFGDFLERNTWKANKKEGIEGSKVNKTTIESLIATGAFDDIEDIIEPAERDILLQEYRKLKKVKVDAEKDYYSSGNIGENWYWGLRQKELCGIAQFDYENIIGRYFDTPLLCPPEDIEMLSEGEFTTVIGYVEEVVERNTRKGDKMLSITLEHNFAPIHITIWGNHYKAHANVLDNCAGKILCLSGVAKYDDYHGRTTIYSDNDGNINTLD